MKSFILILFLLLAPLLHATAFNMEVLRAQERTLALKAFKKLHQSRQHFKHQRLQKQRHKRSTSLEHHTIFRPPTHQKTEKKQTSRVPLNMPSSVPSNISTRHTTSMKPPPKREHIPRHVTPIKKPPLKSKP